VTWFHSLPELMQLDLPTLQLDLPTLGRIPHDPRGGLVHASVWMFLSLVN